MEGGHGAPAMPADPHQTAAHLDERAPALPERSVVLLPDLFVDHFVPLQTHSRFQEAVAEVAMRGGGNHLVRGQFYRVGGNAANTAFALGRLGVPTTLITRTGPLGRVLFEGAARGLPLRTERVLDIGSASTTVALELHDDGMNVMLSDPGPLSTFAPSDLEDADWSAIEAADIVAITNWSQTLAHGTELLQVVLPRATKRGAFTFLDTGDPSHRGDAIRGLIATPAIQSHLSAWGMNGTEARYVARQIDGADHADVDEAAALVSRSIGGRVDVHTARDATSFRHGERLARQPTFPVEPRHRTGSGDAWNAGNLLGVLLGLADHERLMVAHAVATLTLGNDALMPPDFRTLTEFLRHAPEA